MFLLNLLRTVNKQNCGLYLVYSILSIKKGKDNVPIEDNIV
jgi:hypothetical protein